MMVQFRTHPQSSSTTSPALGHGMSWWTTTPQRRPIKGWVLWAIAVLGRFPVPVVDGAARPWPGQAPNRFCSDDASPCTDRGCFRAPCAHWIGRGVLERFLLFAWLAIRNRWRERSGRGQSFCSGCCSG